MERRGPSYRDGLMIPKKNWFWILLRITLGVVFVAASFYKILSPGAFAHQIYNYKILPSWSVNPVALTLPWVQLLCGLCLVFNRLALAAGTLIVCMMFVFQVALFSALLRGLNISCGCFKSGGAPATWLSFGRDFVLFASSCVLWWRIRNRSDA